MPCENRIRVRMKIFGRNIEIFCKYEAQNALKSLKAFFDNETRSCLLNFICKISLYFVFLYKIQF